MYEIRRLPPFDEWLQAIKDKTTRVRIQRRLDKVSRGIFGDHKLITNGIWELREHFGAGYRLYYTFRGNTVVIMLGAGDKSTQNKDIQAAILLNEEIGD